MQVLKKWDQSLPPMRGFGWLREKAGPSSSVDKSEAHARVIWQGISRGKSRDKAMLWAS